jgi:hypothetical protein
LARLDGVRIDHIVVAYRGDNSEWCVQHVGDVVDHGCSKSSISDYRARIEGIRIDHIIITHGGDEDVDIDDSRPCYRNDRVHHQYDR